ncbi:MAG TPA: hypothetical protein VHG69_07045 [Thermoleophilaceae bacterium]|nr:hypothetical protein [Thermoleophilaceae bacterium]
MPRVLLLLLGVLAVLLVASQFVLPVVAERQVEDRLEEGGGSASAEIDAFPALRLLFEDGDRLQARGEGLALDVSQEQRVMERLDGFDSVDVALSEFSVGPFELDAFVMTRGEGETIYETAFSGQATPREVAGFLGSEAGGPLGGLLGDLAAESLPGGGSTPLPIRLRAQVESRDGRVEVTDTTGTVAGVPAGPFAQLVVELVVRRL